MCCWSTPTGRITTAEILWDYDQENPLADARGFQVDGEKYTPNQQENIARNKTLVNGARYYVDHAHPEYSTPEVTNVRDLVVHEKAGERILEAAAARPTRCCPRARRCSPQEQQRSQGQQLRLPRELPDGPPHVLQADRRAPDAVLRHAPGLLRVPGKVGSENRAQPCDYQISQRADFFETEVALDTMVKRPIINTRDEPHADREKYRRLHVIVGDANMSRVHDLSAKRRHGDRALDDRGRRDRRSRPGAARPGARHQGGLARSELQGTRAGARRTGSA